MITCNAQYNLSTHEIDLHFFNEEGNSIAIAKPLEFEEGRTYPMAPPAISIQEGKLQNLMDVLWECGVRPSNTNNVLFAQNEHIKDLRHIAFTLLKAEK